ncbi:MAG: glycosyltransferase family 4 protein [Bacteroides sp.]|nr:glycosyltransferase family 4 protein [Bacteroides sp.]
MSKIVISHPTGNTNVRSVIHVLHNNGILDTFHTCISCFKNSYLYYLSYIFKDIKRREFVYSIKNKTQTYPIKELSRIICQKLHLTIFTTHETGIFCIDNVYKDLDKKVSTYIKDKKTIHSIYAYEDGAYETFKTAKKNGIICLYDIPSIYWRAKQEILKKERQCNPKWISTFSGLNDSVNKFKRKDFEIEYSDTIFIASTYAKDCLKKYYPKQLPPIHVIPYGFPTINIQREYIPFKGRKIRALYVGALTQNKGLSYLFESIQGLEEHIELTVIGKGNINGCPVLKEALKKVNYIPSLPHDEVLQCMAEHDVFIFPSLFEGFGLVITEAMSQGTPVITTERTCAPDLITHDKDGWIVKAGESAPIRELLEKFIQHPEILQTVGKEAMKTASKRPWSCYENELIASIKTTLSIA